MSPTIHRISEGFPEERLLILPRQRMDMLGKHPLSRQLHPSRLGYFPHAQGHYMKREAGLDEDLLILCIEGKGCVSMGNQDSVPLLPSQIALLPAGETHHYEAAIETPWTIAWIHFKGEQACYYRNILGLGDRPVFKVSGMPRLIRQFDELYQLVQHTWNTSTLMAIHAQLANLLAMVSQNQMKSGKQDQRRHERLERVLDFLHKNIHRSVSVDEMAKIACWTPNHMSMLFSKEMHMSPATYFMHIKMNRACEILRNTNDPIGAVADALGFEDPYYFSRCFRRCYQMSPSEYRKTA